MDLKIQNFPNFKKKRYICYSATSRLPVYKISSQYLNFWPPKWSFFVSEIIPIYEFIFFKCDFCNFWGRTQTQMTPLDSWAKTGQYRYIFCPHL